MGWVVLWCLVCYWVGLGCVGLGVLVLSCLVLCGVGVMAGHSFLVALQAGLTLLGNTTVAIAALRIAQKSLAAIRVPLHRPPQPFGGKHD